MVLARAAESLAPLQRLRRVALTQGQPLGRGGRGHSRPSGIRASRFHPIAARPYPTAVRPERAHHGLPGTAVPFTCAPRPRTPIANRAADPATTSANARRSSSPIAPSRSSAPWPITHGAHTAGRWRNAPDRIARSHSAGRNGGGRGGRERRGAPPPPTGTRGTARPPG